MLLKVLYFSLKIQKLKIYLLLNEIFLTEFSQKKAVPSLQSILYTKYTDSRRKRIQREQIK